MNNEFLLKDDESSSFNFYNNYTLPPSHTIIIYLMCTHQISFHHTLKYGQQNIVLRGFKNYRCRLKCNNPRGTTREWRINRKFAISRSTRFKDKEEKKAYLFELVRVIVSISLSAIPSAQTPIIYI